MCGSFFLGSLVGSISIDPSYTHTRTRTILRHCLHKHPKKYNSWVSLCIYTLFCCFFFLFFQKQLSSSSSKQFCWSFIHSFHSQFDLNSQMNDHRIHPIKTICFRLVFFHLKSLKSFFFLCVCSKLKLSGLSKMKNFSLFKKREGESFSFTIHFISKE